jgi:hypothetical protein
MVICLSRGQPLGDIVRTAHLFFIERRNNMRKSALCLLLALVTFCSSLSHTQYAYADEEGDYTYTIVDNRATITDFPRGAGVDITIPNTLGGVPVTAIGETAFYITDLTSVVFPNSLTSIGDGAFGYNFLTSLDIPYGVTSIGARAFQNNKLTTLVIPDSVTSMGQEVFKDNLLTSVDISDNLTSISDFAFRGNQLTSVVIPESVASIGGYSFRYNNLSSVTVLSESTVIDPISFNNNQATPANLKMFGYAGSIVQTYARSKGFTFVDGTSLFGAMRTAKQLLKNHLPGTDIGQVPANQHADLSGALDSARQFVDAITNATAASDLNNAASNLKAAIQSFNDAIVSADATALEASLTEANQKLTDHPEGTDVGEAPGAARTALQAAIAVAQAVADDSANQTQNQLDAATADLRAAMARFDGAVIKAGDAAALDALLIVADQTLTDHPEGTGVGETSGAVRTALQAAIGIAQAVADDSANQTQNQLDASAADLRAAIATFEGGIIKAGDAAALGTLLVEANQKLTDHPEGTGVGETSAVARTALQAAIGIAQAVADDSANQTDTQLGAASADLRAAIATFEGGIIKAGDAAALGALLIEANQKLTEHPEGTGVGETSGAARAALQAEIGAAQAVANDSANQTQNQLDAAIAALNNALTLFEAAWVELVLKAPADDLYGKSEILHFTVNYGYEVTVSGTPTIPLVIGTGSETEVAYASYSGAKGVGLTELSFDYEIPEGLADEDGIAINPQLDLQSGASIRRASGSAASIVYTVQNTSGIRIVSIPPLVALAAGENNGSEAKVTVKATIHGAAAGNTLAKLVWVPGSHNIADFTGIVGTDILAAQKFSVTANGIYTVYARDAAGNESVKEIAIAGIGVISPGPGGNSSGNPGTITPNTASIMLGGVRTEVRVTTEIAADGQSVKRLHLTPEQVAKSLANGQADLLITVEGLGSAVKVSLPAASILKLSEGHPDAIVRVIVNGNGLQIPLSGAKEIQGEGTLTVTIAQASDASSIAIQQAIVKQSAVTLLEHPIVLALDVDGKPISTGSSSYAQRTITLPAAVAKGKATAVWIDANNKLHFAPSLFADNGTVTIHSPHDGVYAVIQLNRTFADLQGHWAQGDIELLASKLIVDGQPDGSFAPNQTITRAEFAALLVRALGLPEANAGELFTDVKESSWYAGAVGAAEQAGLIGGFEDGSFRPNASITREQMAVMIARALSFAGKTQQAGNAGALQPFADVADISDWAIDATEQLVKMEIIQGLTDTTFVPKANASRAQSAVILKRMLQYLQYINS